MNLPSSEARVSAYVPSNDPSDNPDVEAPGIATPVWDGEAQETSSTEPTWLHEHFDNEESWSDQASPSPLRPIVGGFLIALALAWTGAVAWAAGQSTGDATSSLPELVRWAAIASGPLALIGLGWLLFGRSSRNETVRFTRTVQAMRTESEALQGVLANVGRQLAANRASMADEAARLMSLGEEAAGRLGAVTRDVDAGAQAMARYADTLDRASGSARTDIGVLLADLPKAEAQARAMSETLRSAGLEAHAQASALEAQMSALVARARDADEAAGGAAGRLTAHVAQVESAGSTATGQMEAATATMSASVDAAFERASRVMDATRIGIEEQGSAMFALVEQSGAAMDRATVEASAGITERVGVIAERIDALAGRIAEQDTAAHTIIGGIDRAMGDMETRFAAMSTDGAQRVETLGADVADLSALVRTLLDTMADGDARLGAAAERSEALRLTLGAITSDLVATLPAGLGEVEARTMQSRNAVASLGPDVAEIARAAGAAQQSLSDVETLVARQQDAVSALLDQVSRGLDATQGRVVELGSAVGTADADAVQLLRETAPMLIEALLRVREAAAQATVGARDAIATAIPDAAARMGEATGMAMHAAITGQVTAQIGQIGALAEGAVEAARHASERLTRQMITIGETTAAVEGRIAEAEEALREQGSEQFSRRVALLIESLNSTAIDVAKILSNEVTDGAWAQYLKGDRGVFTRRAVRLLDTGEAREIVRHYEEEPEFREQVNRYVHDFEALLRRVLAEHDGSPLGVTLLSSDMGKLYVALAQAIERIRG